MQDNSSPEAMRFLSSFCDHHADAFSFHSSIGQLLLSTRMSLIIAVKDLQLDERYAGLDKGEASRTIGVKRLLTPVVGEDVLKSTLSRHESLSKL